MTALNAFGLEVDFDKMGYGDAYLSVMDDGKLVYEASSNAQLNIEGSLDGGLDYLLTSSCKQDGGGSKIVLNGKEYSMNKSGLNIVVYHKDSQMVLDSLCFGTGAEGAQPAVRGNPEKYLRKYSDWRASEDYRRGIR
jgi:hypothetical protein